MDQIFLLSNSLSFDVVDVELDSSRLRYRELNNVLLQYFLETIHIDKTDQIAYRPRTQFFQFQKSFSRLGCSSPQGLFCMKS